MVSIATGAIVHQIHPESSPHALTDDQLLHLYGIAHRRKRHVRANFISSIDGSAAASGLSGPLGSPADKRIFDLLRQLSDVVLVGAGTVRDEGYGALRLSEDASRWRVDSGLAEHPTFAIVSASLRLDPNSEIFTKAPVRPLILTTDTADSEHRTALSVVADVVSCGELSVEASRMCAELERRGLSQVHCEGGPKLLGMLIEADALDELCLTVSPLLEGGYGSRISTSLTPVDLRRMHLDHILVSESMIFTRYRRTV